jgi:AcrR family transcriptional regulator
MATRSAARTSRASRRPTRLPTEQRRRQLLDEAGRILTEGGVEQLQITEMAARVGVSRPLVYRLFPTRQALVQAVLEDFALLVNERFHRALVRALPGTVESVTTAFVEASCDAIEQRGAGPWRLFDARGADPALTALGRSVFMRLLDPWQHELGGFLGVPARRAGNLLWVIATAGRAALDGWIDGTLRREEAIEDATRAVSALLVAFATHPPAAAPSPPTPGKRTR